jgi:hypothetical protein
MNQTFSAQITQPLHKRQPWQCPSTLGIVLVCSPRFIGLCLIQCRLARYQCKEVSSRHHCPHLLASLSNEELCRNEEWLRVTKAYTMTVFIAAAKLRIFPKSTHWLVNIFLPDCIKLQRQFNEARRVIMPVISHRRELRRRALEASPLLNSMTLWIGLSGRQSQKARPMIPQMCS